MANCISELMSNPWRSGDALIMSTAIWNEGKHYSQDEDNDPNIVRSLSLLVAKPCLARVNIDRAHVKYSLLSNADQGLCTWSSKNWVKERSPRSLQKPEQEKATICTTYSTGFPSGPSGSFVLFRSLRVIKGAQASVLWTSKRGKSA